jgi:DNA repair photolyase
LKKASAPTTHRKITSGTREWADHNVNCIKGCLNNCRYCYAKLMARRFRRATYESWSTMRIREEVVKRSFGKMDGRVMFPSSHDIVDIPDIREACLVTLGKLLESGNEVLVTTKPKFSIIQQIDNLYSGYKKNLQFRFTITSINNNLLRFWEPNAPLFDERFESLKYAFGRKYKTSVSIEPFLDRKPQVLVHKVKPFCTESIWVGKMNYIRSDSTLSHDEYPYFHEVRRNYEINNLLEIYNDLKKLKKIRFKDSVIIKLSNHNFPVCPATCSS